MTALHYTAPYAFTCRANPMNWNDRVDIYIYLEEETQRSTLVFINRSLSIDHSGAAASAVGCFATILPPLPTYLPTYSYMVWLP